MQDSFELRAKADNLRNKTEEENKKALRRIDKMKNNPQNSEYNLLFKYKDGIFTNTFKPNDDNVTYPSYLPEQQNNNQTKKDDGYDLEKALEHLRSNAKPSSTKECGKYVRNAIAAGGVTDPDSYGSAKNYVDLMPKLGFTQIDSKGYTPRAGDVVIHDENGINHPDGHAAMFDGDKWISDFVQTDMYGGGRYRSNPKYTLWRR